MLHEQQQQQHQQRGDHEAVDGSYILGMSNSNTKAGNMRYLYDTFIKLYSQL